MLAFPAVSLDNLIHQYAYYLADYKSSVFPKNVYFMPPKSDVPKYTDIPFC